MTQNNHNQSRRDVIRKGGEAIMGIGAVSVLANGASAAEEHSIAVKSVKKDAVGLAWYKLQVSADWSAEGGEITELSSDLEGRAGSVDYSFNEITTREESGGIGESYWHIYAEAEYSKLLGGTETNWIDVTIFANGNSQWSCKHDKVTIE